MPGPVKPPLCHVLIMLFVWMSVSKCLWAQHRPVRAYRSGIVYDTIRIIPGQSLKLSKTRKVIPMAYPAISNAPQHAKHRTVLSGPISLTIDIVDSYCGSYNGSVLVHASGGTPPYTYSFDGMPYQSSALYVTDGPFDHTVSVKDAAGQIVTQTVHVGNDGYGPAVYASTYTQPSGCNASDATLTVQGQGGTPPYEYSMDLKNWQTTPFTGLSYGWYYVWAKDARGCISNALWWPWDGCIGLGGGFSAAACGNTGSISMKAFGYNGELSFEYSLDGAHWQKNEDFSGLGPGTYTLQIKDNTGKINFFRFIILESCQLTVQATVTDATCGQSNGQIVASATNGYAPYEYSIDGLHFQSNATFTGLPAGYYTIWVHDLGGTLQWTTAEVKDGCPTVTAAVSAAYCGHNDGSITAVGNNGKTPYTFSIDGVHFQSSAVFSPLMPGNYTITIKDADGFLATTTATVGDNCLQVTAIPTNTTCSKPNGAIKANGQGGSPPYSFSIDGINFQGGTDFNNLMAGNYTLTIQDQTGDKRSIPVNLTDAPGAQIIVDIHNVDCNDQGGSLTIRTNGGKPPLTYSIDGNNYGTGNIFNKGAGTYWLYVKDNNGCITAQSAAITMSCLQLGITGKDASCTQDDGEIDVTASGGRPSYEYSIDGGSHWQTGTVFQGLSSGNYTILGRDADGLSSSASMQLARVCITGALTVMDASCGRNDGTITVIASGGTAPYAYSTDGVHFQNDAQLGPLAPGNYTVEIKDSKGFSGIALASIAAIPSPSITVKTTAASCLNNDGVIEVSGTGGSLPYQYKIDETSFVPDGQFTGAAVGEHQALIMDARGCTDKGTGIVTLNNTVTASITSPAPICEGRKLRLDAVSNAESFAWTPGDGLSRTDILTPEASPASTKVYYLTAITGICQKTISVTVTVNPAPVADAGKGDTVCYGISTQLHGSGGSNYSWTPATYLSDPGVADPEVSKPLSTTIYNLSVTDDKGCRSLNSAASMITVTPPPAVWIGNDTSILAGQPVPMEVKDINESGFVDFSWSPATGLNNAWIRDPVAMPEETVTYTVLASTAAGCQAKGTRLVKVFSASGIFVPNAFTPNGDGYNDVLHAKPVGIREFKYFAIFNRWGQRIFYTADPAIGWDGNMGVHIVNGDTYVWMAAGIDYRGMLIERKGTVILVR